MRTICALMDELAPDERIGAREKLITFVQDRPGHDLRYAIDASRMRRELGWSPQETFESGLAKTIAWYPGEPRLVGYGSAPGCTAASGSGWWRDSPVRGWRAARTELAGLASARAVPLRGVSRVEGDVTDRQAVARRHRGSETNASL